MTELFQSENSIYLAIIVGFIVLNIAVNKRKDVLSWDSGKNNFIGSSILFAIIGFLVGYYFFGESFGRWIPIKSIFGTSSDPDNAFVGLLSELIIKPIREKILISTLVGGIIGYIIQRNTAQEVQKQKSEEAQ